MARALPQAQVSAKAAAKLRKGYPWVYRTELLSAPEGLEPGAIVQVVDVQKNPIGQAFWARKSPIAIRLLTRKAPGEEAIDEAFFRRRLEAANARRNVLGRTSYRVVHGEGDGLPGLFVDRYDRGLTLQTLSEGMDARKDLLCRLLVEQFQPSHLAIRDDASGRDFEGLPREARLFHGTAPALCVAREGENLFEVDLLEDMKTGSFLDQLDNHVRAGDLAHGEGLDTFSYHGGFALSLARHCTQVTAVEQDAQAAARAKANAERNGRKNVSIVHGNAFDVLHQFDREGRKFDTIVIDPPGLAKRKEGVKTALRAYRELNLRAFKCLRPEGVLVSCSCSGKVTREMFEETVLSAAQDARRTVQILERRGAGLDHPVLGGMPESEYLKALFLRVIG